MSGEVASRFKDRPDFRIPWSKQLEHQWLKGDACRVPVRDILYLQSFPDDRPSNSSDCFTSSSRVYRVPMSATSNGLRIASGGSELSYRSGCSFDFSLYIEIKIEVWIYNLRDRKTKLMMTSRRQRTSATREETRIRLKYPAFEETGRLHDIVNSCSSSSKTWKQEIFCIPNIQRCVLNAGNHRHLLEICVNVCHVCQEY